VGPWPATRKPRANKGQEQIKVEGHQSQPLKELLPLALWLFTEDLKRLMPGFKTSYTQEGCLSLLCKTVTMTIAVAVAITRGA
jgi:hypothetical protein